MSVPGPLARAREALGAESAAAGDPKRRRAIILLACVLALDSADLGTLGAVAAQLEDTLRINDLQIGLLASVVSLTAAMATLPVGWLTDRVPRVPLLAGSIGLWSAAMIATGASQSYTMLLVTRLFLGAVQATSGPTLASLTGDYFRVRERSRIFGWIHAGELLGAAVGFLIAGQIAAVLSWRYSFWALAIPGAGLAVAMWRLLPEPRRGGESRFAHAGLDTDQEELVARLLREQQVEPDEEAILDVDPRRVSVRTAVSYLARIRTFVLLTAAFSLGYFFLGGARTFGVVFFRGHFHLGQAAGTAAAAVLGVGALAGVIIGGRLADRLLGKGRINARMLVGAAGYLAAAILFAPGIWIPSLVISLPIFVVAAAALTLPSAPLDAGLLDLIPAPLWGRAEGLQTATRTAAMALAPVLFGYMADLLGGTAKHSFGRGTYGSNPHGGAQGLALTFLIMLVTLAVAGLLLFRAHRSYARDAATAGATEERMAEKAGVLTTAG